MISSNIWKLYVIRAVHWFMLIMPVIVIFYQANGLSMKEVLVLQAAFSLVIILLEVPSGHFADVFGRKPTILIASIFAWAGLVIYSLSYSFWAFLFAEIVLGVGASLISGADSAMLYETLLETGSAGNYKRYEGVFQMVSNLSEGVASVIGGAIAVLSLRLPFIAEAAVSLLAVFAAMTLKEPPHRKHLAPQRFSKKISDIIREKKAVLTILFSAVIASATMTVVWFIQPLFRQRGLPLVFFGVAWAFLQFVAGLFSYLAHRIEALLGLRNTLILLPLLVFAGYLGSALGSALPFLIFLVLVYAARGIKNPVVKDILNKEFSSSQRATALSVLNLSGRLLFALLGPVAGYLADIYTIEAALAVFGVVFLVSSIAAYFPLKNALRI